MFRLLRSLNLKLNRAMDSRWIDDCFRRTHQLGALLVGHRSGSVPKLRLRIQRAQFQKEHWLPHRLQTRRNHFSSFVAWHVESISLCSIEDHLVSRLSNARIGLIWNPSFWIWCGFWYFVWQFTERLPDQPAAERGAGSGANAVRFPQRHRLSSHVRIVPDPETIRSDHEVVIHQQGTRPFPAHSGAISETGGTLRDSAGFCGIFWWWQRVLMIELNERRRWWCRLSRRSAIGPKYRVPKLSWSPCWIWAICSLSATTNGLAGTRPPTSPSGGPPPPRTKYVALVSRLLIGRDCFHFHRPGAGCRKSHRAGWSRLTEEDPHVYQLKERALSWLITFSWISFESHLNLIWISFESHSNLIWIAFELHLNLIRISFLFCSPIPVVHFDSKRSWNGLGSTRSPPPSIQIQIVDDGFGSCSQVHPPATWMHLGGRLSADGSSWIIVKVVIVVFFFLLLLLLLFGLAD